MTDAQKTAMDTLYPVYGLAYQNAALDIQALFGNGSPVWLEIGFGDGEALLSIASTHPEINFLGIEVHAPGVGHLLAGIERLALKNVRVMRYDALEVLDNMIAPASLDRILLFFPDPWHKKRHQKRRILQANTIASVKTALKPGGVLHCATDWEDYAESMLEVLQADSEMRNLSKTGGYAETPDYRPRTKFEERGLRLGHSVADLLFEKS